MDSNKKLTWLDYEKEILEELQSLFPRAVITHNVLITGRYSKVPRQIDILMEDDINGSKFRTVVDGKFFSSKVDVKEVECFIGMLNDIDAHNGILVTNVGYSKAAQNRANYGPEDVMLDILNIKELKFLQSIGAIPYSGGNAVAMRAPFGWIVDAKRRPGFVATLYQRGFTLDEAGKQREWMYVKFMTKNSKVGTAKELAELQNTELKAEYPDAKVSYLPTVQRKDAVTLLRKIEISSYPTPEYTGFIEFNDFIFFAVLFTPTELAKKNIIKLEYIMANVLPMKIAVS